MYKNYLLALLSGILLAISWPTDGFPLFIFIAFVPLLIAENNLRQTNKKYKNLHSFLTSYAGFLLWNVYTTWWIWNSTAAGAIFALLVNSLLMAIVFQLYHIVALRKPLRFSLIFLISIWIGFEKFHLNWDFSWPWLNLGNVFSEYPQWIQWYEYTGSFGGCLWILLVNVSIFSALISYQTNRDKKYLIKRLLLSFSLVVIGIYSSLYLYHSYREKGNPFKALVLQPNTNPYTEKYAQSNTTTATELIALINPKMDSEVQFILAPETVLAENISIPKFYKSKAYASLHSFLSQYPNTSLITGASLYKVYNKAITPPSVTANKFTNTNKLWYESYNAALCIQLNQKPEIYKKSKLVVGVEHFPFRSVLQPLLGDVMIDLGGSVSTLTPQKEVSVFKNPTNTLIAAPIICYETIYGEYIGKYIAKNANFLAIITNDSWWGNTQGHKQLLSYARLRAVEHRRSIARSANSGISAFIDQKGTVISHLDYETKGALKGTIYANNTPTLYSKYGDYIARVAQFVAIIFLLIGLVVKKDYTD